MIPKASPRLVVALAVAFVLPAVTAAPLPALGSYQAGQAGEWHLIGPARLAQHGALPFSSEGAQEFRQRKDNTCALAALRFWLATQSVWTSEKGLEDLLADYIALERSLSANGGGASIRPEVSSRLGAYE